MSTLAVLVQRRIRFRVRPAALRVAVLFAGLALAPAVHAAGPMDSFRLRSGQYTPFDDLPMPKPGPNNWQALALEDCAKLCLNTPECGMFLYSANTCRMHKPSAVAKLSPQPGYDAYVRKAPSTPIPWKLDTVVNNSGQDISIGIPVMKGASAGANVTSSLLDLALFVPGQGVIAFQYDSAGSPCSGSPHAKVTVSSGGLTWAFYYDAGTSLGITLNPDGTFTLTPGPGGQIVPAGQSVRCAQ